MCVYILVVFFGKGGKKQKLMGISILNRNRKAMDKDIMKDSSESMNTPKHVLIVMDGMKEFTTEPLEWVLKNIVINAGSTVTLLGVMPWLNIPLSSKTWLDVWPVGLEELSFFKEKNESRSDIKYLKLQKVVDLCNKYGVFPQKKVIMGYPSRSLVVEQIATLHATWVVFDRHQKNDRKFYAGKLPCNMVMMNEDGEVDMIRGRLMIETMDSAVEESPAPLLPTPHILISDHLKGILKKQAQDQDPEEKDPDGKDLK